MDNIWITREISWKNFQGKLYICFFLFFPAVLSPNPFEGADFRGTIPRQPTPRQRFTERGERGRGERSSTLELISRRIARIPPTPLLDFPRPVYMRRMRGSRNGGGGEGEKKKGARYREGWRKLPEEGKEKRAIRGEDKHEWNIEGEKRVRWVGKRGEVCGDASSGISQNCTIISSSFFFFKQRKILISISLWEN